MKIIQQEVLFERGSFTESDFWKKTHKNLLYEIRKVEWPEGKGSFCIYPECGKKRSQGNGVKPIKNGFIKNLIMNGWKAEEPLDIATRIKPGNLDAVLYSDEGTIALEWETGNISSSHRALNKLALGLIKGAISAGILVMPSRKLYRFLTDRIGNISEIEPYLDLWRSLNCKNGILEIIVIEHDSESFDVPRIPKGTDGRSRD